MMAGTRKPLKIVKFGPGEAHLQNTMSNKRCYICHKDQSEEMVLMHIKDKDLSLVCPDHPGVIQEFIRQFKMIPLGWVKE